jgi:signal transduction histidine kinase
MRIAPRVSVRANLALAILLTIAASWVLSGGIANYYNYLSMRSIYREMVSHPEIYGKAIPEPKFGVVEFLTGRPPFHRESGREPPERPRPEPRHPPGLSDTSRELRLWALRVAVAFALAGLAGAWLGRRFTRPLTQLAKGAGAFHGGDFAYRIPIGGRSEFAAVATAMNEMARKVSDQITDLEKDAERRRQFLADIAHELRSPVATMRTMAGALKDGVAEEPERRERALSALVRTSERLQRLVQDLMELAQLDLNELPLKVRQVDLRELVQSVIQAYDGDAAAAGVVLRPLAAGPPVNVAVDPDRITQVLDNVLGNAVSYAGSGSEVAVLIEDGDTVRVTVRDTGKGIRASAMAYVFDPFYRADAARTPGDSHSGLGLRIASRLVEAHGGELTIASEEGKGTSVTIAIPRKPAEGE